MVWGAQCVLAQQAVGVTAARCVHGSARVVTLLATLYHTIATTSVRLVRQKTLLAIRLCDRREDKIQLHMINMCDLCISEKVHALKATKDRNNIKKRNCSFICAQKYIQTLNYQYVVNGQER